MRLWNRFLIFTGVAALFCLVAGTASAVTVINEVRIDQTSTDFDEYFEIKGTPGTDLTGLTYLVIGDAGAGTSRCGVIECVVDLGSLTPHVIQADGLFCAVKGTSGFIITGAHYDVTGVTAINFENTDNVNHYLVQGFSGANNQDLDTNDDGILDVTPWTSVVDCIGVTNGAAPVCDNSVNEIEPIYCGTSIGPDGSFHPGHIYRCRDTNAWMIGPFNPVGGVDTPGDPNLNCLSPPPMILAERRNICAPLSGQSVTVTDSITTATSATLTYSVNGGAGVPVAMSQAANLWSGTIPGQVNGTKITYSVVANNAQGMDTGLTWGYFAGTKTIASLRSPDPVTGAEALRFYGVRIHGNATVAQGVFSAVNTDFYVQDGTGGIRIFKFGLPNMSPGLGDEVTISGELDQFNGQLELENSTACGDLDVSIDSPGSPPAPTLISSCQLGEATEGLLIRMQFPRADTTGNNSPNWGANKNYPMYDCVSDTVNLFIDADTNIDGTPIVSTKLGLVGISNQFDTVTPFLSGYECTPRSLSDITYIYTSAVPTPNNELKARLLPNAPNPFARQTLIRYDVAGSPGAKGPFPVQINVYDVAGRRLGTIVNESKTAGSYETTLDASQLGSAPSGIYFYDLVIDGKSIATRKLVVSR